MGSFPSQPISDISLLCSGEVIKKLRFDFSLVLMGPNRAYIFCYVFGPSFSNGFTEVLFDEFPTRFACVDGNVFFFFF